MWDQTVRNGYWNLKFVRSFNDWEVDLVVNMFSDMQKERVTIVLDKVIWRGVDGGRFSVKEAYRMLQLSSTSLFPAKGFWVHVPLPN